jgi:murein DD-endopeptidase MepM/ murein hydrolase activator NlpD
MSAQPNTGPSELRRGVLAALAFACLSLGLVVASGAGAQDLQSELDSKEAELEGAKEKKGVLSTEIEQYTAEIDQLLGEVATLRNREAIVQARLDRTQARLDRERAYLEVLRKRLERSIGVLEARLVDIYKSDEPDALTVILQADGFDDLLQRYQYLDSIQEQDASIVDRVHSLRNQTFELVESIRSRRDEIAAREAELERTRLQLEAREAELDAARAAKADALAAVEDNIQRLEGDIGDIQADIQAQIQAAQAAAPATPTLPAGPVQGESSSGFIWPVSGPVVSPFGWRWGRMHEGIDIAVPSGTPVVAVASGTVVYAGWLGGYGNLVVVDHGNGLSTAYAHNTGIVAGVGASVGQGQTVAYSGSTGNSSGPHVHFEVRVNGSAVDPLGYL